MNYKLKSIHISANGRIRAMAGLRERQKAGRRRDILAAAAKLFRRDGFAVSSIEAIAAEAEVAAGTVYNYFESKGDLLIALVALDGEEVRAAGKKIIANPPKDAMQAVTRLLTFYLDHSMIHLSRELWRNAMANALSQPSSPFGIGYAELDRKLADQVGELIACLQERGQIDAAIDPKTAGDVLFEVVNSLFMVFVAREEMPIALLKRRLTHQVRLVFAGLGNPKAVE
jgi:AcrR family transcriptional regulator